MIASNWRGHWAALLLWGYLLSPLAVRVIKGTPMGLLDPLLVFNLTASLLFVGLVQFAFVRPVIAHLALAPLYLTTAVDLFLLTVFDARLSAGYLTIALTDHGDAKEFLFSYWPQIWPQLSILCLAYGLGLWGVRVTVHPRRPRLAATFGLALGSLYLILVVRTVHQGNDLKIALLDLAAKEQSAPLGAVFQAALTFQVHQAGDEARRNRQAHKFNARQREPSKGPNVIVWVVGESSRPENWSLFGYARDTTPFLRQQPQLLGLRHMQTTAPHTSVAVPSMFSLRPITDWPGVMAQKSIVAAFREAGYRTVWLSAQEADSWGGFIPHLAAEASRRRYFERNFDGALLPELQAILNSRKDNEKLFVVMHSKGSHFEYSRRYPAEFSRFIGTGTSRREKLIDTYDNSILYTDWFLKQTMDALESRQLSAALVYASDHGENLLDDERQLFGHAIGNGFDLSTAAFIWFSPRLVQDKPEAFAAARVHANEPMSLSVLAPSVLHLADIDADGLEVKRSIFSPQFAPQKTLPYLVRGELKTGLTRSP